jgi:hypothetical protein
VIVYHLEEAWRIYWLDQQVDDAKLAFCYLCSTLDVFAVVATIILNLITPFHTVRGNRPGKPVQLQEYEIKYLCTKAREIFINQPILLELEAPIKICG